MPGALTMLCPRCWGDLVEPSNSLERCRTCHGDGRVGDVLLSRHFRLSEMLRSSEALRNSLPNEPNSDALRALSDLVVFGLEPIREQFGPLQISSGYRDEIVNVAARGSLRSAHPYGHAADFVSAHVSLREIARWIEQSSIPFDQLIYEGTWIHLGMLSPEKTKRRERLMMFGGRYSKLDFDDPRVV